MTATNKTLWLTAGDIETLREIVSARAKRAERLGLPVPTIKVGPETRDERGQIGNVTITKTAVQIIQDVPSFNGWKLVAVLTFAEDGIVYPTPVITRPRGSECEIPNGITCKTCDHCNTSRTRNRVVVVQHDTDGVKALGLACAEEYLGVRGLESLLNSWCSFAESDELESFGSGYSQLATAREILSVTWACVKKFGYIKASDHGPTETPTYSLVQTAIFGNSKLPAVKELREELDGNYGTDEEIDGLISWLQSQSSNSEYIANLKILIDDGSAPIISKRYGIVCSAVASYFRHLEIEIKRAKVAATSNWIGVKGDKVNVMATVTGNRTFETQWGSKYLVTFADQTGNVLTWWGTSQDAAECEIGQSVTVKGSIKELGEYRGTKQTVLTRCKIAK